MYLRDEASAALLGRIKHQPGVSLTGCQLFIKQMLETAADTQDENADALPAVTMHATKNRAKN
jgi:hypothetical protein